ncbi:polyketide synthase dehydratase domain-containing protein [Nocardia sp. NPDC051570]|uniref:polyketide synthase dehydratase domain-containing protein n=1 Tax=Nocardia sp. NPDC051570 TaxID=3364324 RepID=UPI00379C0B4B
MIRLQIVKALIQGEGAVERVEWWEALREVHRQTSAAHAEYQRALADGQVCYLRASEETLCRMIAALRGAPTAGVRYGHHDQFDRVRADRILEHLASAWQAQDRSVADHPVLEEITAEITVSDTSHPQLRDHTIAGHRVVPLAMMLDWFLRAAVAADIRLAERVLVLDDVQVLAKATVPDLGQASLVVRTRRTERENLLITLIDHDGRPHCRATVHSEAGTMPRAPHLGGNPSGPMPLDRDKAYASPALFHGPQFQAIAEVDGITAETAVGTLLGVHRLGWPAEPWRIDPAAVDGVFQLAVLWAEQALGAATLPMSIRECRFSAVPPADEVLRCVVRAVAVDEVDARCDAVLTRADGSTVAEFSGLQLVVRPPLT